MSHGGYGGALFDPKWKAKRAEILARDKNKCVICGSDKDLQVHHRQYHFLERLNVFKDPWEYEDKLMITLCNSCHNRGHRQYKVPM
ncbi:MAG: HNH endonuclease [Bacteroidales bacterium]|nr:HNH endonuclease [Bacteroidales bacterium]